jgi:hypothetical protein
VLVQAKPQTSAPVWNLAGRTLQKKTCGVGWSYLAQSVGKSRNLSRQQGIEHHNIRHDDGGVVATKSFETAVRRHLRKSEGSPPSSNLDAKIPVQFRPPLY